MSPKLIWISIIVILSLVAVNYYRDSNNVIIGVSKQTKQTSENTIAKIGGAFTLNDQNGMQVEDSDFIGKYMLVFFGFTNCPAICPTGIQVMSNAMVQLEEKGIVDQVVPIFITVDPERDTAERHKEYFANFHPSFKALTGNPAQLKQAHTAYKVYAKKVEMEGSDMGVMFDHSSFIYLMDKQGELVSLFQHNDNPEKVVEKIVEVSKL